MKGDGDKQTRGDWVMTIIGVILIIAVIAAVIAQYLGIHKYG